MKTVKNILIPLRFTRYSLDLLEYAMLFSRAIHARLHLLHVISGDESQGFLGLNEFFHTVSAGEDPLGMRQVLEEVDLEKVHIRDEEPHRGILRYAREHSIDLILLPAHSPGDFPPGTLGETTRHVLEQAPCPVMVLHLPASAQRAHRSEEEMDLQELKREIASGRA